MRRYEVSDGQSHKFWEITLHGESFSVRFGRIGSEGQHRTKELESADEARAEWERLISEKVRSGYRLVHADGPDAVDRPELGVDEARSPELEQAIEDNPLDEQRLLVYADWLQGRNDPRGELITVQHALSREKDPGEFLRYRKAEQSLLQRFAPYFYGERFKDYFHLARLQWRLGFFGVVSIDLDAVAKEADVAEVLSALFDAPSARFLHELRLQVRELDLQAAGVLRALAGENRPRALVALALGELGRRPSCELGDVSSLWPANHRLRRLELSARSVELGAPRLPELERLELRSVGAELLRAVALGEWPALGHLALSFDRQSTSPAELGFLLEGRLPRLRRLGLLGAPEALTDAVLPELADSRALASLEVLDLSFSQLGGAAVGVLQQRPDRFGHLKRIVLTGARLHGRATAGRLASLYSGVEGVKTVAVRADDGPTDDDADPREDEEDPFQPEAGREGPGGDDDSAADDDERYDGIVE